MLNLVLDFFNLTEMKNNLCKCNYCGQDLEIVWVHGHGQCAVCKINIEECCRGEKA
jgi:hypothetical protein